jgi:Family of unknown function (DUF6134)
MHSTPSMRSCPAWFTARRGILLAAVGFLLLNVAGVRAAAVETRRYTIQVDGKKAGEYQLVVTDQGDGIVTVAARSDVRVTVVAVPVYTYSYVGQEVWRAGRLQHFASSGKENGKDFAVRADADPSGLRVQANGVERHSRPDVWTTSCWQLPEARFRNNDVSLLGCDTGVETASHLQFIGNERIMLGGQAQDCAHYRVMKDVPHDLWYDARERLVRDEAVSGGHRTVVELTDTSR